jgi:hypothetical protein
MKRALMAASIVVGSALKLVKRFVGVLVSSQHQICPQPRLHDCVLKNDRDHLHPRSH